MSHELTNPVHVATAINEQRGCPYTIPKATEMGFTPTEDMTPSQRKQEYYFLLDGVLGEVMENVREYRERFPYGLVELDKNGEPVEGLSGMLERVRPHIAAGDFVGATYWVHDAMYRTIDAASEVWNSNADTTSGAHQRISRLVDDKRQERYGGSAVQKRVSSAANQTVHISASMQRMTHHLYEKQTGERITPEAVRTAHATNIRFAMPMTQLHLQETRPLRELFGTSSLPGGNIEMYDDPSYFTLTDGGLLPVGDKMLSGLAAFDETFPDGRIGCPGLKYIPEIWNWAGELTDEFAIPALAPSEYTFTAPTTLGAPIAK